MTKTRSPKELAHNRNEAALKILEELGAAAVLGNLGTVPALIATAATRPRDAGGNEDKIARELRRLAAAIAACTSYRRTARGRIAARLVAGVSGGTAPHVAADGGVCWGPLLTPNDPNVLHKGGWRTVGVHDFELLAQALRTTRAGGRLSALAIVVEACGLALPVEPFRPIKRASLPALQRVTEPQRELPAIQASPTATEPQLLLPGFAPLTNDGAASWLLALYDQAGGQSMRQGRGAPWDLRLFVAALLHVPIEARTGARVQLPFRLPEIVSWLHPDGWENRRRDWNKLPAALARIGALCVPMPCTHPNSGKTWTGLLAMVHAEITPKEWSPEAAVMFTVRIPAQAAHGARIEWPRLCQYGKESAVLYRAYLSVCTWLDNSARRGQPLTRLIAAPVIGGDGKPKRRKGGAIVRDPDALIVNPAAQFVPELTDATVTHAFGFDPTDRYRRRDARCALERLVADGVIELEQGGRRGRFRIFGPRTKPDAAD